MMSDGFIRTLDLQQRLVSDENSLPLLFPDGFLKSLRAAVDSGLTCDQITSMLVIQSGVIKSSKVCEAGRLVEKVQNLMGVIEGSIKRGL